jgi:hypothetical protein
MASLVEGLASIRDEMSRLRADVLRWSLLFWLGQFAALATMFSILLRALGRSLSTHAPVVSGFSRTVIPV